MFYIKQLECLYCDVKNPNRSVDRDQVKEIEEYTALTRDQAREVVLDILAKNGGVQKLAPKILSNDSGFMWIECDQPSLVFDSQGSTDLKCLALQIKYSEQREEINHIIHEMKNFAETLGPKFSL